MYTCIICGVEIDNNVCGTVQGTCTGVLDRMDNPLHKYRVHLVFIHVNENYSCSTVQVLENSELPLVISYIYICTTSYFIYDMSCINVSMII